MSDEISEVTTPGFESPDQAAMDGFPAKYCRVVATRTDGDDAYVLLDTGPSGHPYLYGVNCKRRDGRWFDMISGNGPGWSGTDQETRIGTWTIGDEAPPDADMVRVEFDGKAVDEPVVEGAFLGVWWRRPSGDDAPRIVAFRIKGEWIAPREWRYRTWQG